MRRYHMQGYNADVDIGTEDIWSQGGTYAWPAAAAATTVVSDSAADTAAGTGARTVRVKGLDANLKEITEDASLNGVTPVALTNLFFRINSFEVLTAGSGAINAGIVAVKHAATFISAIPAGAGRQRQAIFTCSAQNVNAWRIKELYCAVLLNTTDIVSFTLLTRKSGGVWQIRGQYRAGASQAVVALQEPLALEAGEDVRLSATALADNSPVCGGFDILGGSAAEVSSR